MMCDIAEIQEIDINPLLADERGVLALDARVRVSAVTRVGHDRLSIRPYPEQLEEELEFAGRTLLLRPIKPEDEPQHRQFFNKLDPGDIRFRFFGALREPSHSDMARFTQIDYDREMAFVATSLGADDKPETFGVVRAVADPDNLTAEFSIVVRSDLKGRGLGRILLSKIIDYCRDRGTRQLIGQIMVNNRRMLALARDLGFRHLNQPDPEVTEVCFDLQETPV